MVTPSLKIEEQYDTIESKLDDREAAEQVTVDHRNQARRLEQAKSLLLNVTSLVNTIHSKFSELPIGLDTTENKQADVMKIQMSQQGRKSNVRNKLQLSLLRQQY